MDRLTNNEAAKTKSVEKTKEEKLALEKLQ